MVVGKFANGSHWSGEHEMNVRMQNDFNWYDGHKNEHWKRYDKSRAIDREDGYLLEINGRVHMIALNKSHTESYDNRFLGFMWKTSTTHKTWFENYGTFHQYVFEAVKSSSYDHAKLGEAGGEMPLDLSRFFNIYEVDDEGKYHIIEARQQKMYVTVKVNYEKKGAIVARQSIFKIINNDPDYGGERIMEFGDFGTRFIVSAHDFNLRFSSAYGGNILQLKDSVRRYLRETDRVRVEIDIDLSKMTNVVGIDFDTFTDIDVQTMTIQGTGQFRLLDNAIPSLQTLRRSAGIEIIKLPGNANYAEVVI